MFYFFWAGSIGLWQHEVVWRAPRASPKLSLGAIGNFAFTSAADLEEIAGLDILYARRNTLDSAPALR
jgi:hypothetical protein